MFYANWRVEENIYFSGTTIDPLLRSSYFLGINAEQKEAKSNEAMAARQEGRQDGWGCRWSALNTLIWLPLRGAEMKVDWKVAQSGRRRGGKREREQEDCCQSTA